MLVLMFLAFRPDLAIVEEVRFEGQDRATHTSLRHLCDLRNGTSIWFLDLNSAEDKVERHPWVKHANARFEWPATVLISVEEYQPIALLLFDGMYYVDHEGSVFARAQSNDLDYPVLTGLDEQLVAAHPDLPRLVINEAVWLLDELDEQNLIGYESLQEVHFSRTRGFVVHTMSSEVLFGLDALERGVQRLQTLLDNGLDLDGAVHVDLAPTSVAIVRPLDLQRVEG
jgi:cell division protein FtsQ